MPKGQYDRSKAKPRSSRRDDIIKAAAKIYAHYGFEGATIERMAEAAGVNKSLVLSHFGDKQELVRAVTSHAVEENLERIRAIDAQPGITLRQREKRIFSAFKKTRNEWRLVYGTLLVPRFQFDLRSDIERYMKEEHLSIQRYLHEFQDPTADAAQSYAYTMTALRQQYVLDGREEVFLRAQQTLYALFLLPEEEHFMG